MKGKLTERHFFIFFNIYEDHFIQGCINKMTSTSWNIAESNIYNQLQSSRNFDI
jgi:hypothetical protein